VGKAVDEFEVREEGIGHVLVKEGSGADEVEGYSVWAVFYPRFSIIPLPFFSARAIVI
jgi:hypothetical protein